MKFRFEVKGRAALREAIEAAAHAECVKMGLAEDEQAAVVKARAKKALDACKLWSADGTTFTIEIDTEAPTCEVVPC